MASPSPDLSPTGLRRGWSTLRDLNSYQWLVFAVAALAWMADCMDQQLFNLVRVMSITDLTGGDPKNPDVVTWATWATAIFLIGWGAGGLTFGMFGDRIGRVRTLTITILLYSAFTGLSALSVGPWDYCLYRFLTGIGVGGVFAAAVALLSETMPAHARPFTLGLMQALSAVGNCTAASLFILLGLLELNGHLDGLKSVGLTRVAAALPDRPLPGRARDHHSAEAEGAGVVAGRQEGGRRRHGQEARFLRRPVRRPDDARRHALLGMVLAFSGVVGLWGIAFFSIDLQQKIFPKVYAAEAAADGLTGDAAARYVAGQRIVWAGVTSLHAERRGVLRHVGVQLDGPADRPAARRSRSRSSSPPAVSRCCS